MCSQLSLHPLNGRPGASQDGGVEGSRMRACVCVCACMGVSVCVPEK